MAGVILSRAILYRLVFPNGKSYIGITSRTIEERFYEHCKTAKNNGSYAIHKAIRKYGKENILIETLVIGEWVYLTYLEKLAISSFKTKGRNGYNLTNGGEGVCGLVFSAESLLKLSVSHKGKRQPLSEETKLKISIANKGKKRTAAHNEAMSLARKGQKISPENLQKLIAANTGRRRTDLEKAALSKARKGISLTAEHKAKLSAAKKGKPLSEKSLDNLKKLIESNKGRRISPETCAKRWATRRSKLSVAGNSQQQTQEIQS